MKAGEHRKGRRKRKRPRVNLLRKVRSPAFLWDGEDLTGQTFGVLKVEAYAPTIRIDPMTARTSVVHTWRCVCRCGAQVYVRQGDLKQTVRACRVCANAVHGHVIGRRESLSYQEWRRLRAGARHGRLRLCGRWGDFRTFLADVGPSPAPGFKIVPDDPDLEYGPGNGCWRPATRRRRKKLDRPDDGRQGPTQA